MDSLLTQVFGTDNLEPSRILLNRFNETIKCRQSFNAIQHRLISRTIFRPGKFPGRIFVLEISITQKHGVTSKYLIFGDPFTFFVENRVFSFVWLRSQLQNSQRYAAAKFARETLFFSDPTDDGFSPPQR